MSYVFGRRSRIALDTCELPLKLLAHKAIATSPMDFSIICGHRGKADQDKAVKDGTSKVQWPHSKHNSWPSMAFDAVPYPLDWDDLDSFKALGEHIKATWSSMDEKDKLNHDLVWGGDWKNFKDYPHFEIVRKRGG